MWVQIVRHPGQSARAVRGFGFLRSRGDGANIPKSRVEEIAAGPADAATKDDNPENDENRELARALCQRLGRARIRLH